MERKKNEEIPWLSGESFLFLLKYVATIWHSGELIFQTSSAKGSVSLGSALFLYNVVRYLVIVVL